MQTKIDRYGLDCMANLYPLGPYNNTHLLRNILQHMAPIIIYYNRDYALVFNYRHFILALFFESVCGLGALLRKTDVEFDCGGAWEMNGNKG